MARIIQTGDILPTTELSRVDNEWVYNGLDVCVTLEVLEAIAPMLDNVSTGTYEFSKALQGPILDMTMRGILVNQERRGRTLKLFRAEIEKLSAQLDEIIRDGIGVSNVNWRSPAQLKTLLYDVMQLPVQKKRNANGIFAPTVDREALEKLGIHLMAMPICNHLLALRELGKKIGFLETGIDPDGRMRTNFNIAGTNTGRLASAMSDFSTGTNLQNVDRELRSVFMSDPGWKFANLDLEQGDSRNLGAICWDTFRIAHGDKFAGSYLDACESGDLHTTVCRMARPGLPWTGDPKADRAIADQKYYRNDSYRDLDKKLGHGSNYLGQPTTMAKHAKVPVSEVKSFQHNYFNAFQCIPLYHKHVAAELKDFSALTTLYGRRRFFFGRDDDAATLRQAVAYRPQSMTGDAIDTGILRLWRENKVQLLIQVHDSILLQYREEEEAQILPWALKTLRIEHILDGGRKFFVPTEAKVGWNWGDRDKEGIENPDGLMKWKGGDDRKRTELSSQMRSLK